MLELISLLGVVGAVVAVLTAFNRRQSQALSEEERAARNRRFAVTMAVPYATLGLTALVGLALTFAGIAQGEPGLAAIGLVVVTGAIAIFKLNQWASK